LGATDVKAVCKMLVKLSPGANFIYILLAAFVGKCFVQICRTYLKFLFVIFC